MDARPWRSVLYMPASNARAMEKARSLAADAIAFARAKIADGPRPTRERAVFGDVGVIEELKTKNAKRWRGFDAPYADLACVEADPAANRAAIRAAVAKILARGAVPLVIGGDDSVPIPAFEAFHGRGPFTIVQIDAHIDWREEVAGERFGLSSTMRRASEMAQIERIVQVGQRGIGSARPGERVGGNIGGALSPLWMALALSLFGLPGTLTLVPMGVICGLVLYWQLRRTHVATQERRASSRATAGTGFMAGLALVVVGMMFRAWYQVALTTYLPAWVLEMGGTPAAAARLRCCPSSSPPPPAGSGA